MSRKLSGKEPVPLTGQYFLRDSTVIQQIIRKGNVNNNDLIIDIGAGRGALTIPLAKRANKVIAIVNDPELVRFLSDKVKDNSRIELINSDIRNFTLPYKPYKVISNIPYSITSDIIGKLRDNISSKMTKGVIVIERADAQRFTANVQPDPRIIGWNTLFDLSIKVSVTPGAFKPSPNVQSVILVAKRTLRSELIENKFFRYMAFVCCLLSKSNASSRSALSSFFSYKQVNRILSDAKIPHQTSIQQLSINQWIYGYSMLHRFLPGRIHPSMPGKYKKLYSG